METKTAHSGVVLGCEESMFPACMSVKNASASAAMVELCVT
jgi:hypothetical protein